MDKNKEPQGSSDKNHSNASQNIRVFVRVRPTLAIERGSRQILECTSPTEITVKDNNKGKISDRQTKSFRFNQVFSPQSSQVEVYKHVVEPLLEEVLQGYSCTVFAYGQTGTGKTFTMEGEKSADLSWGTDPNAGIIPRTLSELFDRLRLAQVNYAVRISFLELYNEELIDLLSAPEDTTKLRLYEDATRKGAVIINGLEEVEVLTKADVYKILEKGSLKRQTASTLMNAHSSRSHTVFTATLYIRDQAENLEGQDVLRTGKINLVDLAGSENIGRSGAMDKRAREAGNINQSLLTLGRVITALVEQSQHIPYRESKLTRLLQESLGGRTKTSIIATVSPVLCNYEETLSTLEYAHRAKNIQNKPEINQRFSKKLHLKEYTEEIERLHRDLEATRQKTGVFLGEGEYEELLQRLDILMEESKEKVEEIKVLKDECDKLEAVCSELSGKIDVVDTDLQDNKTALEAEKSTLVELKSNVEKTVCEEREQTHLVAKHWETGQKLKAQATVLKSTAEVSSRRSVLLHDKLDRVRSVTKTNENLSVEMQIEFSEKIESALNLIKAAVKENADEISDVREKLHEGVRINQETFKEQLSAQKRSLEEVAQIVEESRKIAQQKAKQEIDSAVLLRDSVAKRSQSTLSFDSWFRNVAKPSLTKQREQEHECRVAIDDVLLKATEGDSWPHEVRQAHTDIISRHCTTIVEEQVPALNRELKEFQSVETNLSEWKKDHSLYRQKMREQMALIAKSLQVMQEISRGWQETSNARSADIVNFETKFSLEAESLKKSAQELVEQGCAELARIKDPLAQRAETICSEAHKSITQLNTSDQLGDLPSRTFEVIEGVRTAWKVHHEETILHIEQENVQRNNTTQSLNNRLEEAKKRLEDCVNENSGALDQINSNFSDLTDHVELRVSSMDGKVEAWTSTLKDIVSECQKRVHRFYHEDYQQCVSTGETPQRENISYPRELPATSPHERIISRFREKMRLAKLSSEDESSECQTDGSNPSSVLAVDCSAEIDEVVRNKENSDSVRESPLKKSDEKKPKCRKPLVSQNGLR